MRGPVPVDGWDDSGKKSRSARNLSYTASWRYIPRDMPPPFGALCLWEWRWRPWFFLLFEVRLRRYVPRGRTRAQVTSRSARNPAQHTPLAIDYVCTMRGPVPVDGWDDSGKKSRSARNLSYTASWGYIPRDMPPPFGALCLWEWRWRPWFFLLFEVRLRRYVPRDGPAPE